MKKRAQLSIFNRKSSWVICLSVLLFMSCQKNDVIFDDLMDLTSGLAIVDDTIQEEDRYDRLCALNGINPIN